MKTNTLKTMFRIITLATLITSVGQASDFYKCMSLNIGAENTTWTMFISQSLPQGINSQMSVEDILLASTVQKEIEKVVFDVAQQNIARFVQNSTSAFITKKDYNFNTEFTHSLRLFTRHLRMRLNQLKNKNWTKPISFQIMFAPKISENLLDRRSQGLVPRLSVYPADRMRVMEQMPDADSLTKSFNDDINQLASAGINLVAHKAVSCGSSNPYLVAASIQLNIHPDIGQSGFKSQLVMGMPMGTTVPFVQANEQIQFTSVIMPEIVSDKNAATGFASLSEFPMAFVDLSGDLTTSQIPLLVRFGTIGSYNETGWERSGGNSLRTKVPRLRGTPVGKIKDLINVDFSVFNVAASIDYNKYKDNEALEIKDLNLYISAGLNALSEFKVGMINKKQIDDQFKNEINKTIKESIEKQTQELKNKSVGLVTENTPFQPNDVESLLKALFSTGSQK